MKCVQCQAGSPSDSKFCPECGTKLIFKWGQDEAMPKGENFDLAFDELLKDRFVLGSPEECFEQLRPYCGNIGVNHLVIRTHWAGMPLAFTLSSMMMISRELLPELREI